MPDKFLVFRTHLPSLAKPQILSTPAARNSVNDVASYLTSQENTKLNPLIKSI